MSLSEELIRVRQIVGTLSICSYYHLLKLAGNLIDKEEGIIEHRVSQLVAQRLLRHLDFSVEVSGLEHLKGLHHYSVISSHASYLDWAVLLGYFPSPLRFIARKDLTAIPVIGNYLEKRGVLIDRSRGIDARQAIRNATEDGQPWPILLFAEGTRTHDGQLQPFKKGGLRILTGAGLSLLPVRITGTFDSFPRKARFIKAGGRLRLLIGEPVHSVDDPEEAMAEVERRVNSL